MTLRRVLVTGATGFIGVEVARQLAERGVSARLMVHRPHRASYLRGLSQDLVTADVLDAASIDRAIGGGIDAVIHLAGRATFESYRLVRPTLVDGTVTVATAAAKAGVSRFVFASSMLVYRGNTGPVDESTTAAPQSGYGRAKREAEIALEKIAERGAMTIGVLRLPHVYGARDTLFGMARRGWLIAPGRGDAPFSHLHVYDAANALIRAAERGWCGVSPIADDAPASWRSFVRLMSDAIPGLRVIRLPAALARIGAPMSSTLARMRGRMTLQTPDAVAGWNGSLVVKPGTLWPQLGTTPRYPTIESGVPAAAREDVGDWVHSVDDHRAWRVLVRHTTPRHSGR
jgi:nucleoside-diphosphate-sugar epimerase